MCCNPQNCHAGREAEEAQGCAKGISFPLLSCPEDGIRIHSRPGSGGTAGYFYCRIQEEGFLVGAVIIFPSEHNSALNLSASLGFSPSVDIVFIVSLINAIILLCQPKKPVCSNLNAAHCISFHFASYRNGKCYVV